MVIYHNPILRSLTPEFGIPLYLNESPNWLDIDLMAIELPTNVRVNVLPRSLLVTPAFSWLISLLV